MHIIAVSILLFLNSFIQPTEQALDTAIAWDKLHIVTQRYLEKNARFYVLDDSGRLWNKKIYLQDADSLKKLSRKAREIRLSARDETSAPAWYCVDTGTQIPASPQLQWITEYYLNQSTIRDRHEYMSRNHQEAYLHFEFIELANVNEYRGKIYKPGGVEFDAVITHLPTNGEVQYGDVFPLYYSLIDLHRIHHDGFWKDGEYLTYKIPKFKYIVDEELDNLFPIINVTASSFPSLSPKQLATEILDRNLSTLPEWRIQSKPNPDYESWVKREYSFPSEPPKKIYTWIKKPYRIRLYDD